MSSIVRSLKFVGKEHPCAVATRTSSSTVSDTSDRTPTFSNSSAWLLVSNMTLAGWNAIGLRVGEEEN